jgi:hypothetical protein
VLAAAGAGLLVLAATWPLARHLGSRFHDNTDPFLFSWVMQSVFRNLLTRPTLLLDGGAFYPWGQSLTLAEPLVTPALVAGPLLVLTENPVLAYNLTLLAFWALSGWAAYAVGRWLTRSDGAGLVAMLVFTLAPMRIDYAPEFQMEMAFGLPLAVYLWVRFLEEQRVRHLGLFLLVYWLQAIAVWYYALILGIGIALLSLQVAALRWTGWRGRTAGMLVGGGAALGLGLAPVALPFFTTRRELGLERRLDDIDPSRYADLLTYVEARNSWLWGSRLFRTGAEASLFVGAAVLALALLATIWVLRDRRGPRGWAVRATAAAALLGAAGVVVALAVGRPVRAVMIRSLFSTAGMVLLGALLLREVLEGRRHWRAGIRDRRLSEREWIWLLWGLGLMAFLLSLGPSVHLRGHRLGGGLYAWLYPFFFPLHAIRSPTRFGALVLLAVALLAAFGTKWLVARAGPRAGPALVVGLAVLVLAEYASSPQALRPVASRAVDAVLAADPADVAILEWPLGNSYLDADAEFRAIRHRKRLVNGFAGFTIEFPRALQATLAAGPSPLSTAAAWTALRRIYPLRYLLVRSDALRQDERPAWRRYREVPPGPLRFRGTFGGIDLYEVLATPEIGGELQRLVAYDLLVGRPILRVSVVSLSVRDGADADEAEEWVDVGLNGRAMARISLGAAGPASTEVRLDAPLRRVQPNVITLAHGMRRREPARFPVGATGAAVPGHLRVISGGQAYGDVASIRLDDIELAPGGRGYTLVAIREDAKRSEGAVFDTFEDPAACRRLAAWIDQVPSGLVVAGAVKDEASVSLCPEGVEALHRLGVAGDLRGRFRESHAFVGVHGAAPGQAIEVLGPRRAVVEVGTLPAPTDFELRAFDLRPVPGP